MSLAITYGKRHDNVNRKIDILGKTVIEHLGIQESTYTDSRGRVRRSFLLPREAVTFLVLSFTGKAADEFKMNYVDEHIRMAKLLA